MSKVKKICQYCSKAHSTRATCHILNSSGVDLESFFDRYKKGESANILSKELGISVTSFIRLLAHNNIKTRTLSESTKLENKKMLYMQTNLERHGSTHNMNRDHPARIKMHENLKEKYGVDNVFQLEDTKRKIKNTMLEKYNVESPCAITTCRGKNSYSSVHKQVVNYLLQKGVDISIEKKLGKKNAIYFSYDIIVNNTTKLIEVNGDYWHGNPRLYKSDDLIMKRSSAEEKVSSKWEKDKRKIDYAIEQGYSVYVIWEYDLKNDREKTYTDLMEWINDNKHECQN